MLLVPPPLHGGGTRLLLPRLFVGARDALEDVAELVPPGDRGELAGLLGIDRVIPHPLDDRHGDPGIGHGLDHPVGQFGALLGVALGQQLLFGWEIFPLPLDDLGGLRFATAARAEGPSFFRGAFELAEPRDTFLALPGWTKGVAWINGFNLGRYWSRGPQRSLYVPGPVLREGTNELVVFELHGARNAEAELRPTPDLGPTEL